MELKLWHLCVAGIAASVCSFLWVRRAGSGSDGNSNRRWLVVLGIALGLVVNTLLKDVWMTISLR